MLVISQRQKEQDALDAWEILAFSDNVKKQALASRAWDHYEAIKAERNS